MHRIAVDWVISHKFNIEDFLIRIITKRIGIAFKVAHLPRV